MEAVEAVLEQLRVLDAKPDTPMSIFDIGVPLMKAGHSQEMLVNALFYLESKKTIELLPGNRLRLITPL
ncbi:hypothetical protein JNB91_18040 [Rhizobium wenxiniae]|uniref:hypothetical protein n=1 Tax=Rhizobium wenxiniae TaxID=1737357 RepID=UPI001C6E9C86|nr:hypothetical protein [Rhizobium wenxiniae]MBW9089724.1 hypothetical protein [Rhizobium wenxiniae]